ncbi:hypothetical protein ACFQL4_24610 [Halosimplex aquaticum]
MLGQLLYLLGNAPVERVGARPSSGPRTPTTRASSDRTARPTPNGWRSRATTSKTPAWGRPTSPTARWWNCAPPGTCSCPTDRAWWPDRRGTALDPFEFYTTTGDYEATVSLDLDEYERRQGLIAGDGYETAETSDQFAHWVETVAGDAADPVPTGELALNSMRIMEGIYRSQEAGRELTAEEIAERSESTAVEL